MLDTRLYTRFIFKLGVLIFVLVIWGLVFIIIRLTTGKQWSDIRKDKNIDRYVQIALIVVPIVVFVIFFLVNNGYVHIK